MGYIDPGLFGTVSQIGLAILFVVTTSFTLFFKPIKKVIQSIIPRKTIDTPTDDQKNNPA